ncbi:hypothetical protein, partial [Microbispora sp. ATCC PTA-5024]|uniref:hypothetical protein n=1 Tax=Microbispora sp. ATCC PTA-5024 TaxID=316330 RepID=UPI000566508E
MSQQGERRGQGLLNAPQRRPVGPRRPAVRVVQVPPGHVDEPAQGRRLRDERGRPPYGVGVAGDRLGRHGGGQRPELGEGERPGGRPGRLGGGEGPVGTGRRHDQV